MYDPINEHLPIGFSMALAHNPYAFNAFLKMDNIEQDKIICKARATETAREMQRLVDSIPLMRKM